MLFKVVLTALVGTLSVNALTVPVARFAESEREFPQSFFTASYHDLTLYPSIALSQREPEDSASGLKFRREPSFELEIRDPDLNEREPEPELMSGIAFGKAREYYSTPWATRKPSNPSPSLDSSAREIQGGEEEDFRQAQGKGRDRT